MSMWFHPSVRLNLGFPRILSSTSSSFKSISTALAFLNPTQSSDDEYASSSSSLSSSTASSSYANSTATDISGYTHNLNTTKTSTPVAQDLFDASRVVQILNSMERDPKTAISFFDRLKEQGFAHDVSTYAALVRILCHWGLDRKLDAVFLEVIVGSSNGHCQHPGFEISDLFERLVVVEGLQADETLVRAYNALVKSYVSIGMFDEAIDVLFQTKRRGFIPHIFTCNFLMNRLIEHGKVDMAVAIYEQLKRLGLSPNDYTYAIMIKALCRKGDLEAAVHVFQEMEVAGITPRAFAYTAYIRGLCTHQRSDLGYQVLQAWKGADAPIEAIFPTQPSEDDEYASSSSLSSSTASSSYANSTATDICGYTHNLNPTKTSTPVAQGLFDASWVVQILDSMKRDPKTAISFFDRLKEQGFAHDVRPCRSVPGLDRKLDAVFLEVIVGSSNSHRQQPGFEISDLFERLVVVGGLQADETLVRAYNALVKSYVSIGIFDEAIDVLFQTKRRGFIPHIFTCNFLMNRLIEHGKVDMAVAIYEQLKRLGLSPNDYTYAIMIKALCRKGDLEAAVHVFQEMEVAGITPRAFAYTAYIKGLCTHQRSDLGYQVLQVISLFIMYLLLGFLEMASSEALDLLEYMEAQGLKPKSVTHNMIIEGLCKGGKVKEAEEFLWTLEDKSVDNYSALVNGYCEANCTSESYKLFFRLSKQGVLIKKSSCVKLLTNLCLEGVCDGALVVLETMLALNVEPSEIMYSKVLAALCRAGDMKKARWFFDFLVEKGSSPDVISYTMMIHGFCKMNCLQEAQDLFHDMKERGIEPDVITYTVLLDGHSKTNLRGVCSPLDARENKEGKVDGSIVWTEMRDNGIRPDVICYTVLIDRYCKTENLQDAVALFDNMIDRGLEPDTVTYTALLSGYCNKGDVDKAVDLFKEMSTKGILTDTRTVSILHHGIIKAKKLQFRR
ncbi:pentatricopeptide repeat-containing protein At2g26790, mitochondrial [Quercus suber]|uniref:pentatricopeptide repeat-containing protein At2g26790, mitochondrial n=1 Tax=Quercus suber TaxID=58331 RepID=UPI0032DF4E4E